ncbi:hypothetical protein FB451DRAFT_1479164 [Mycena latifolia]|nr:hypothetical protein FB451DRAFT_1479164 [Mycena latifolia]
MVNAPTTAADMYLVETLNLHPDKSTDDPNRTVTLHEVENALSTLVASMFWTRSGTVTEVSTQGRLNASIIAIATQSELGRILPQVENPTTDNLRETGMIRTRLLDSRSPVSAAPWKELPAKDQSSGLFQTRDNAEDALLNPGTTLFRPSREVQNKSRFHSSKALRSVSLFMHSTLIAIHLILAALWSKGIEHRLIFSLAHQSTVALLITAITTAFGTLYSALLVLVTQTLYTRRSIRMDSTLTAIHDTAAAWNGIGSAVLHLWHQMTVRASVLGVCSALLYLGNILVLHVTTPALFSLETFRSSRDIGVGTNSLPVYNWSADVSSDMAHITQYLKGSLLSLPSILSPNSTSLGLHEGTLYDTLEPNSGTGNVSVNATGFNITCGYLTQMDAEFSAVPPWLFWNVTLDGDNLYQLPATQPGIIAPLVPVGASGSVYPLTLYSTIPITDSSNNHPAMLDIHPPLNSSVSFSQILRCTQTLVPQTAVVDAQTGQLMRADPTIRKTSSTWSPATTAANANYADPSSAPSGNLFIDLWAFWYRNIPMSTFSSSLDSLDPLVSQERKASLADLYLVQKLNLHSLNATYGPSPNLTAPLHEVENVLSSLVASMFWTLANVPPTTGPVTWDTQNGINFATLGEVGAPPSLLRGSATATEIITQGIIAIGVGLFASIALFALSLPSLASYPDAHGKDIATDGTGILYAIWLYRNRPELHTGLAQVEDPTIDNLREAGMVQTSSSVGRETY